MIQECRKKSIFLYLIPLICGLFLCNILGLSQVKFEEQLSWTQIKKKSKKEKKHILVDLMATWCRPCQEMDKEVYSEKGLGELINDNYISVKLQLDTTAQDNDRIRQMRPVTASLVKQYNVIAVPTLLVFNPDGEIVQKVTGFKDEVMMREFATAALDPNKQIYTRLRKYKAGMVPFSEMPQLAMHVATFVGAENGQVIYDDYIFNYLLNQSDTTILRRDNLAILLNYLSRPNSRVISLSKKYKELIDSVAGPKSSTLLVSNAIRRKFVDVLIQSSNEPNWDSLETELSKMFNNIYISNPLWWGKFTWYKKYKKGNEFATVYLDGFGVGIMDSTDRLWVNAASWAVFENATDPKILNRAIELMAFSMLAQDKITLSKGFLDTYANLLYKTNRVTEAMLWEQAAILAEPKNVDYIKTLNRFRRNEPTWPVKD